MVQDIKRIEDIVKHAEELLDLDLGDVLNELAGLKQKAVKIEALTLNSDNGLAVMINRILEIQPGEKKKDPDFTGKTWLIRARKQGRPDRTFKVARSEEERAEFMQEARDHYGPDWDIRDVEKKK